MSIHIHQVLDYLDTHPVCQEADTMESLLEMLHDVYVMHNRVDSAEIYHKFREMRDILKRLPEKEQDAFFHLTCDLCVEHELLAFSQGVLAGMQLMTEVNSLP